MANESLSDRLNYLFRTVVAPNGKPFTQQEVCEACRRGLSRSEYIAERSGKDEPAKTMPGRDGVDISPSYLSLLRQGRRDNPTMLHLQALANFFEVEPAFFFDDSVFRVAQMRLAEERASRMLRELAAHPAATLLAVRARGLAPEDMTTVHAFVEELLARERGDGNDAGRGQ